MQIAGWLRGPDGSPGILAKPDFTLRLDGCCRRYYRRDFIPMDVAFDGGHRFTKQKPIL